MPSIPNFCSRIYRRVRDEFFPPTHPFDLAKGVDTSGRLNLRRLAIDSPNRKHGRDYQGVEPGRFSDAMSEIREDFSSFTFVDLGCGKGRALMMAHDLGFRRLIGVEFSARLAEIAENNFAKLNMNNVQILVQDVAEFRFPAEPLVVFTFNSFGADILKRVLLNLRAQSDPVYLVYINPIHNATVVADRSLAPLAARKFHSVWYRQPPQATPSGQLSLSAQA
jgi:SAM-dependent methyltransferase